MKKKNNQKENTTTFEKSNKNKIKKANKDTINNKKERGYFEFYVNNCIIFGNCTYICQSKI